MLDTYEILIPQRGQVTMVPDFFLKALEDRSHHIILDSLERRSLEYV